MKKFLTYGEVFIWRVVLVGALFLVFWLLSKLVG